jgi:hypothetical protein
VRRVRTLVIDERLFARFYSVCHCDRPAALR